MGLVRVWRESWTSCRAIFWLKPMQPRSRMQSFSNKKNRHMHLQLFLRGNNMERGKGER